MVVENFYKQPTLVEFEESSCDPLVEAMPKQIGGYKIESLLNKGGMSELYLGIHPETNEPITLKVLSSKYLSRPEIVERFLREAEIIELTCHPNIVKLYGHGKWAGGLYIAMEFVQGISLRQMILQEAMTLKRGLELVIQIAHALTHLHAHGIIHRDLKPENILLTAQGGIKVIDFGISQIFSQKEEGKQIRMMGTPVYMSPEQLEDPLNVDFSTDIYSLGIIMYELVLGRLSHGVIHLALVPRGLQKILAKMLQPTPKGRYEDIVDFIKDLSVYMSSDELKHDMRGSDYLGELSENLKSAQALLLPDHLPKWPQMEMAIASNSNTAISSVYYDFFERANGVYYAVMCESLTTGVDGLLYVAMLKGMMRSLASQIENPVELIAALNNQVIEEGHEQIFSLSFLTLCPRENRFSYISCGYSPLWHIPAESEVPRRLSADNVALGIVPDLELMEVTANWNVGDTLVLHTFQAGRAKNVEQIDTDETLFLDALKENVLLAVKQQVNAIFRKVSKKDERAFFERPVTVISILRQS